MRKFVLFITDIAAFYGALALTIVFRYPRSFWYQFSLHTPPFTILLLVWLIIFYILSLYDESVLRNNVRFYSSLWSGILFASFFSITFFYLIPFFGITPKTNLFIFIGVFSVLISSTRWVFNLVTERTFKKALIIIGLNLQSKELANFIARNPQLGYFVRALVDINPESQDSMDPAFEVLRGIDTLEQFISNEPVHTIVISPETYHMPKWTETLYHSLEQKIIFRNLASFYEQLTGRIPLGAINQVWFLENITEGNKKMYEIGKRFIDIAVAVVLAIVFIVLLPLVAIIIKLTSPGPLFYKQKRLGQAGKTFEIIKLRTMADDAEQTTGAVWAMTNDPRITKIGRFLRKMRIDELPQCWNILKGDMSFIGPRAERPEFHQTLVKEIPFYEERYLVKPGATGLAQLQRSYYASVADTAEKLQYDLFYIKNRSFLLDLSIVLKTVRVILTGSGR